MAARSGVVVVVFAFLAAGVAAAQPRLAAPDEVVIYRDPSAALANAGVLKAKPVGTGNAVATVGR